MLSLLIVSLLSGCLETRIVDEVAMIRAAAFDIEDDTRIKLTANFPTFPEEGEGNVLKDGTITASGETTKGTKVILNSRTQKPIVFGQLRVLLFSEELAKQGIELYVDAMYRDPSVGNRIYLAITEGDDAAKFLEAEKQGGELSGVYLPELIEQNMETSFLVPVNMHQFLFSLYNDGRDPYLPVLRMNDNNDYAWGTALFSGEVLHSMLDHDDSFMLKMMMQTTRQATKQFELVNGEQTNYVVIENISSDVTRTIDKTGETPTFIVTIEINGAIEDYDGEENLDDQNTIKEIEKSIEKQIQTQTQELLLKFQQDGIDPVGVGEKYRSTTRDWNAQTWQNEIYPKVEMVVHTNLKLIQSGAVE